MKRACWILSALLAVGIVAALAEDEISLNVLLKVDNGVYDLTKLINQRKMDQVVSRSDQGIMAVTDGTNTVPVINVSTGGISFLQNLSTGEVTVVVNMLLKSNEVAVFRPAGTNILVHTEAGFGSVLEYWINAD